MKSIQDQVFPIEGYTDKIQSEIEKVFSGRHWLTFTRHQIEEDVTKTLSWIKERTPGQDITFKFIVTTSIRRLIQLGKIKKVKGQTTVEATWQWTSSINDLIYKNITSDSNVAKDPSKVGNRAKNVVQMYHINKVSSN